MSTITQATIAREAGVTKATVSMALRRDPRISAATGERVRAIAERLGYRPDPTLAAAAAARWRPATGRPGVTLAYVSQSEHPGIGPGLLHWQGALARAEALGYRLDCFHLDTYADAAALQRVLLARGIRGLVIGPFYSPAPLLTLDWERFCAVSCSLGHHQPLLHAVERDAFDGLRLAWQRVYEFGCRRPGLVIFQHTQLQVDDDDGRRAAVLLCRQERRPELCTRVPPLFYGRGETYKATVRRLLAWYRRWRPDVIIGFNTMILGALRQAGIRVPEETAFVALVRVAGDPEVAGLREQAEDIGRGAVDLLDQALRTNQWGLPRVRVRHYLEPEWLDGATLPRCGTRQAASRE